MAESMNEVQRKNVYLQGKYQGEMDRSIADLGGVNSVSGEAILSLAKNKAREYDDWAGSSHDWNRQCYILGYLIGYRRLHLRMESSSLSYVEIKDIPPSLFLTSYENE